MKNVHVVILLLENHHGQILVAKRPANKHLGGLWEFPGGKVEARETSIMALKREMKEEINYVPDQAQLIKTLIHEYPELRVKLEAWYCRDTDPQVQANENQPLKWVDKNQLNTLSMPEANVAIIEALLAH